MRRALYTECARRALYINCALSAKCAISRTALLNMAVCGTVLLNIAVCGTVLLNMAVCGTILLNMAVCGSMLHRIIKYSSMPHRFVKYGSMPHLSRYHMLHVVVRGMRIWPPNAAKCCKNAGKFFPDGLYPFFSFLISLLSLNLSSILLKILQPLYAKLLI